MTSQSSTAAVYGSYNARSVLPQKVAKTFVPPDQFWRILPQSNAVITGPRGSGKTTLLKMLTGAGLEHWEHARAQEAREAVAYTGVFVPADRSWAGQLKRTIAPLDEDVSSDLGRGSFSLHVLRALTGAVLYRLQDLDDPSGHQKLTKFNIGDQETIARAVSKPWGLPGAAGSFESLRWALSEELLNLGRLARRAGRSKAAAAKLVASSALEIDVIDAAGVLIDRINDIDADEGHVWMLLIDEIEFLPVSAREYLLEAMRGRDPRIMQKVSLAPYTETVRDADHALGGWSGHDYEHIDLTFGSKESGYAFSEQLFAQELSERGIDGDVESFLGGRGQFEQPPGSDAYGPDSRNIKVMSELAEKDDAFSGWLDQHSIVLTSSDRLDPSDRAATLRQAMPIALIRNEFLSEGGRRRSRKNPTLYNGSLSIFAICENNPRLLKALAQRLIDRSDESGRLSDWVQSETLTDACTTYFRHLRAIEITNVGLPDQYLPRVLIDRIGKSFELNVLGKRFSSEPALSFVLDRNNAEQVDPALEPIVNSLINYGALIPLGQPERRRFGLSHMFAPMFHLPLRRGREVSIETVLGEPKALDGDGHLQEKFELNGESRASEDGSR